MADDQRIFDRLVESFRTTGELGTISRSLFASNFFGVSSPRASRAFLTANAAIRYGSSSSIFARAGIADSSCTRASASAARISGCTPKPSKIPSNWISDFHSLVQPSLVDIGIESNMACIAQHSSNFPYREPIAE
jgi:hypothetical protein